MDLIERQAAIDAILAVTGNSSVRELYEQVQEHGLSEMWSGGVNAAIDIIIALPSAEPTLYGYPVKHLAKIAAVMAAEHINPREAILIFRDAEALINVVITEQQKIMKEQLMKLLESAPDKDNANERR